MVLGAGCFPTPYLVETKMVTCIEAGVETWPAMDGVCPVTHLCDGFLKHRLRLRDGGYYLRLTCSDMVLPSWY